MAFRTTRSLVLALLIGATRSTVGAQAPSYDPVTMDPPIARDTLFPASVQELALTSHGSRMNALMYVAQGKGPHPTVVLLHGFPGNERNLDVAQALRRAGMNVLFFSYRGAWGSGGAFSFGNAQQDVASALRWLRMPDTASKYRVDARRLALVGHSMGGWLAFLGAAADRGVACVGGIEVGDMARAAATSADNPTGAAELTTYTAWLSAPGAPLHGAKSARALVAELSAHGVTWSLPAHAAEVAARPVLLLDNVQNPHHASLVAALTAAGARHLTEDVWVADHSFSERRVELARTIVRWVRSDCGFGG